jgi:hypothetical protein
MSFSVPKSRRPGSRDADFSVSKAVDQRPSAPSPNCWRSAASNSATAFPA